MATIEIDGRVLEVEQGAMVIEAADDAGITIPRFCYHKKLSVAANCRMCLVEIENGRKPMPACATPVTDGMKVFTKSKMALDAQKAVMEFLLVNHPLDCPICDQGGECELQDISMGYGNDASVYGESKRSVVDDDLGSLIATEMTRCIHCTRCVRFGEEIAGQREMGATGRGESTHIGTFVKHAVTSEVSGNIIDLCPVGALTSKPFRFSARAWELTQHEQVASHDCLGSNISIHCRRQDVMRIVPKENESINETWLSDRDRFAYTGANSDKRLLKPMLKKNGAWAEVEWQEALNAVLLGFNRIIGKHGSEAVAALCSPSSTTEEAYLLQKFMRAIGVNNLGHQLHQTDFSDQHVLPLAPISKASLTDLDDADTIFLIGSNVQREQPVLGLRVRKAQLNGANILSLSVVDHHVNFAIAEKSVKTPSDMIEELAGVVVELQTLTSQTFDEANTLLKSVKPSEKAQKIASMLHAGKHVNIILGAIAHNHSQAATLRSLVHLIERCIDVNIFRMTEGANEAGCHIAGMLPHRSACGMRLENEGLDLQTLLSKPLGAAFLLNVDPEFDIANPAKARQALLGTEFVVAASAYTSDSMFDYADVLLPVAVSFETSGTFINALGNWQSFNGVCAPQGEARPAWKVLRVLANLFELSGFEYNSSEEVLKELKSAMKLASTVVSAWHCPKSLKGEEGELFRIGEWPMYRVDAMTRNAKPLQASAANDKPCIKVHPETAIKLKLAESATVSQGDIEITLPLVIDERIAQGAVYVANGWIETSDLGSSFGAILLK